MDGLIDLFWENTLGRIADFFYFSATDKLVEALEALNIVDSFPMSEEAFFELFYPMWGTSVVIGLLLGLWGAIATLPSVFRSYGILVTVGVRFMHGFFVFLMGLIIPPLMVAGVEAGSYVIDQLLVWAAGSTDGSVIEGVISGALGAGFLANFFTTIFAWVLRIETIVIGVSVMPIIILTPLFFALSVRERFVGLWRGWQAFMVTSVIALPMIAIILTAGLWLVDNMNAIWIAMQADKVVIYTMFIAAILLPLWLVKKLFLAMPAIVPSLLVSSSDRAVQSGGSWGSSQQRGTVSSGARRAVETISTKVSMSAHDKVMRAPTDDTSVGAARIKAGMTASRVAASVSHPLGKAMVTMVGAGLTASGAKAATKRVETERSSANV